MPRHPESRSAVDTAPISGQLAQNRRGGHETRRLGCRDGELNRIDFKKGMQCFELSLATLWMRA